MSNLPRRSFLTMTGAGMLELFMTDAVGQPTLVAETAVPRVRPASGVGLFAQPLFLPPTMRSSGKVSTPQGHADFYDLAVRQFRQQVLPDGPATTVWGYGPANMPTSRFHTPSAAIRARRGVPTRVRWRNELVDAKGDFLPHLFAVDPSLHWANVPREPGHGGVVSSDVKPDFTGRRFVRPEDFSDPRTQYTAYDGPVPLVPHLHGAKGVAGHSDGYSEAWFLPKARNIPDGYAHHGRWWEHLSHQAAAENDLRWDRGFVEYQYPNENRAGSTLWYHDHALGLTRLNVYAGMAGFYLVEGDRHRARNLMPEDVHERYELNLTIQDRTFNQDGSLFYPDSREFFDPDYQDGPWYPQEPGIPPIWIPEYFGSVITVNGRAWPAHTVQQRRYTMRLLNCCNARTLYVDLRRIPGLKAHVVSGDQGYLRAPVDVMKQSGWRAGLVVLAPAERYELVLDFTDVPAGRHVLGNLGPDGFFGGGQPGVDFPPADPETTGNILTFDVVPARGRDRSTPAKSLSLPALDKHDKPRTVRRLATTMHFHHLSTPERPLNPPFVASATMMGVIHGQPGGRVHIKELMWSDPVTENPSVGDTEDWVIYNVPQEVGVPHPIHIHEAPFEVVERGTFSYDYTTDYTHGVLKHLDQVPLGDLENGHQDNEMMRPFRVGPVQAGEPEPIPHHGGGGHTGH